MLRLALIAGLATILLVSPSGAQPIAADPPAQASIRLLRPLKLEKIRDLYFGTVMVGNVVGTQTLSIDFIDSSLDGCTNGLTCSGPVQSATFYIYGSGGERVAIRSTPSTLTNATGDTLSFTPDHPSSLLLSSDPFPFTYLVVGGSITLSSTTVDGFYQGDMNVTVDY